MPNWNQTPGRATKTFGSGQVAPRRNAPSPNKCNKPEIGNGFILIGNVSGFVCRFITSQGLKSWGTTMLQWKCSSGNICWGLLFGFQNVYWLWVNVSKFIASKGWDGSNLQVHKPSALWSNYRSGKNTSTATNSIKTILKYHNKLTKHMETKQHQQQQIPKKKPTVPSSGRSNHQREVLGLHQRLAGLRWPNYCSRVQIELLGLVSKSFFSHPKERELWFIFVQQRYQYLQIFQLKWLRQLPPTLLWWVTTFTLSVSTVTFHFSFCFRWLLRNIKT